MTTDRKIPPTYTIRPLGGCVWDTAPTRVHARRAYRLAREAGLVGVVILDDDGRDVTTDVLVSR